MEFDGTFKKVSDNEVTVTINDQQIIDNLRQFEISMEKPEITLRIVDKRNLSPRQRRKTYAMLRDMSNWTGYELEDYKQLMKGMFYEAFGTEPFSLANTDMTTARMFISFLIEVALEQGIPMNQPLRERTDDLDVYMLQSLRHRSCAICGQHADIHHIDAIGMGNDRTTADHRGRKMIALCRIHHQLAGDMGWQTFSELFHVVGVVPSSEMIKSLGLMTQKRMNEIDE
ncbi:putative HNHc nuclease [Weissella viridescens]|uniref:putative HNHc nuclease n=1 Tax=Weissella viridescens TaxID=1629 RepID=UPI003AA7F46E